MGKKPEKQKAPRIAKKATYRVLARQPLSVEIGPDSLIEPLSIQGVACRISIRPAHTEQARQHELGGSLLAVEFEGEQDADLMDVVRDGYELIEDFLSAIAVVSDVTFRPSIIRQVARLGNAKNSNCEFLQFLELPANHWHQPISGQMIGMARHLLAHWDGLENGKRLRRAARRYRDATGTFDDVAAFQEAYIGLEAMEPPLATMAGLTPGTEEIKGACEHCGEQFTRKRTSLVGVRAFVLDDIDANNADEQRKADWKLVNKLRNDLMHGLVDEVALKRRPHDALIASMHHLHNAISICSHAPQLACEKYQLARGGPQFVLAGSYTVSSWPELTQWTEVVETSSFQWVPHTTYGHVPEINIHNSGLDDLKIGFGKLANPISFATLKDLQATRVEMD